MLRAILPLINRCDAAAATLVTRNMDTVDGINTGTNNVPDGFDAVKVPLDSSRMLSRILLHSLSNTEQR